ncbi:MAG: hypothetical protein Q8K75_01730 [Chlamydiales bacterium]|nr:hypothetical protein [Chlamydiales bacterium]
MEEPIGYYNPSAPIDWNAPIRADNHVPDTSHPDQLGIVASEIFSKPVAAPPAFSSVAFAITQTPQKIPNPYVDGYSEQESSYTDSLASSSESISSSSSNIIAEVPVDSSKRREELHRRYSENDMSAKTNLNEDAWVEMRLGMEPKIARVVKALANIGKGFSTIKQQTLPGGEVPKGKMLETSYFLEAAFPTHILADRLRPLRDTWMESQDNLTFPDWLAKNHPNVSVSKQVKYYDENERKNFALSISDSGSFVNIHAAPYDSSTAKSIPIKPGTEIFVMGPDQTIYSAAYQPSELHHSSFLAGGAIIGAGELKIENGELKAISNRSGHYKPNEQNLLDVLKILDAKKVPLENVQLEVCSPAGERIYPSAKQYLDSGGKCNPVGFIGTEVTRDASGSITAMTFKITVTNKGKLAQLKEWQNLGVDLSKVTLKDTHMTYNSAQEFLDKEGKAMADAFDGGIIRKDTDGKVIGMVIQANAARAVVDRVINMIYANGDNFLDIPVEEHGGWGVISTLAYQPQTWSGGEILKNENGKISTIVDHTDEGDPSRHLALLDHMRQRAISLDDISFQYKSNEQFIVKNAQDYRTSLLSGSIF